MITLMVNSKSALIARNQAERRNPSMTRIRKRVKRKGTSTRRRTRETRNGAEKIMKMEHEI